MKLSLKQLRRIINETINEAGNDPSMPRAMDWSQRSPGGVPLRWADQAPQQVAAGPPAQTNDQWVNSGINDAIAKLQQAMQNQSNAVTGNTKLADVQNAYAILGSVIQRMQQKPR